MKIKNKLIIILCFILTISCFGFIGVNADNVKNSNVTQEEYEFFGKWNGFSWTIESQLNYELPALKSIETRVKMGDYGNAKQLLFGYYKSRESFKGIDFAAASSSQIAKADLTLRDIINASGVATPADYLEIETGKSWYPFDIYSSVLLGQKMVFTFMAMGKQDNLVVFDSKEGVNKPYLDITVNGRNSIIYPDEDTFVRAGKYDEDCYGSEEVLEINDTGFPFDDNTRRTTMIFDLSGLQGTVNSAKIFLYGGSTNGMVEVMAYRTHDTAWVEETHVWNKESSYVFSWETSAEGTDWHQPESGAFIQWDMAIGGMGLISDLVSAYVATEDDKYAIKAVDMVLDYIEDAKGDPYFPDVLRTGQRAKFLPQFLNYMLKTDFLDSEDFFKILYYAYQHIVVLLDPALECPLYFPHELSNFHPYSNWGVTEGIGSFILVNFLPELKRYEKDNVLIQYRMQQLLDLVINEDGSYNEDNTGYPVPVLSDYLSFINFSVSNNVALPVMLREKMVSYGKWIVDFSTPTGNAPRYGDGAGTPLRAQILELARLIEDNELLYFGTNGKGGTAPEYTSIFYPDMKTAMMRSGWDSSSLYAHINTNDGTHCHQDQNAIIMWAYGRELLVDTGTKSYDGTDPVGRWQRINHESHNTYKLLDVIAQSQSTAVKQTQLWQTNSMADIYKGYCDIFKETPHTRTVLMVKPNFFIVSDYAKNLDGGTKRYQLNWNLLPTANPTVDETTGKVVTNFVNGANLQIIPSDSSMAVSVKQGYFTSGTTTRNPVIGYDKTSTADLNLSTVLYPTKEGQTKGVSVSNIALNHGMKNAMRINFDGTLNYDIAYYYISNESEPALTNFTDNGVSFTTDSGLFYYQQSKNNAPVNFILSCGSKVVKDGVSIVDSPSKIASLTVGYSSDTLNLNGDILACTDKTKAIKIYAPNVTQVTINGQSVAFEREGDYIYAATSSEMQEAQEIISMIGDLPALDSMTGENVDELVSLKLCITRFLVKGYDVSNISNYDYFVKAQNIVESLISLDDLIFRMKYLPNMNEINMKTLWKYSVQVKKLLSVATELQENLGDDYPIVQEQIDKLNVYVQKIEELQSLSASYNAFTQYSFIQGENSWYNYYQIISNSDINKVAQKGEDYQIYNDTWLQVDNNNVRLANEFLKVSNEKAPVKMWIAPKSGTIKINLTVNAYYNSKEGNGYTAILTKNELPFVNDGTSRAKINTNAIYTKYIKPLDPILLEAEYHTFELVCYVEEGDYIALSVDPNEDDGMQYADYMEYDLNVEFFVGVELNSVVEFNGYNDLYNRIDAIPALEKITIGHKDDIFALYDEIVTYGKNKFSNVKKLEDAVAKINEMSDGNDCAVQVFVNGAGEIILDKTSVNIGDVVKVKLVPEDGYKYKEGTLTVNGEAQDSLSFVVTEKLTNVICDFEPIKYTVQTETNEHAKVHLSSASAGVGEKVYFFVEPDYGYAIKNYQFKLNGEVITENYFIMNRGQNVLSFEIVEVSAKESNVGLIIGVSAGVVVIAAAGVVTFILLRKKRIGKKSA